MPRQRVTMADVAREAGVSLMTVSRVVNNKTEISVATRARVQAVIDRLGYRPSDIARSLATSRTGTAGRVVPDIANPFFSDIARGVEAIAYAANYNVFLCNTNEDPQREIAVLRSLEEKRVDGVILCSSRRPPQELHTELQSHPVVVLINRALPHKEIAHVMIDDATGGRLATQHLIRSGHSAIGMLGGPKESYSGRLRAEGYRRALAEAQIAPQPGWYVLCDPSVEKGRRQAAELLARHSELTALFCYNDLVAVGALQACADLGRSVPEDIAIVGYDDIPLAALISPALTTCRVDKYRLGAQAMRLFLNRLNECEDNCTDTILQPELIVRESAP